MAMQHTYRSNYLRNCYRKINQLNQHFTIKYFETQGGDLRHCDCPLGNIHLETGRRLSTHRQLGASEFGLVKLARFLARFGTWASDELLSLLALTPKVRRGATKCIKMAIIGEVLCSSLCVCSSDDLH